MQQFCQYGSVRGATGNRRPYRDIACTWFRLRLLDGSRACAYHRTYGAMLCFAINNNRCVAAIFPGLEIVSATSR